MSITDKERSLMMCGARLDLPHFNGNNLARWVFKATQFYQTHVNHRLLISLYHMECETLVWYQDVIYCDVFWCCDFLSKPYMFYLALRPMMILWKF